MTPVRSQKHLLRMDECQLITGFSKRHLYDLLHEGLLLGHSKDGLPGKKGTRVLASSLWKFLDEGVIAPDKWVR